MPYNYQLIKVSTPENWLAYHKIRRKVLFEDLLGRSNYNDKHEDEYLPNNHPLLLLLNNQPIGTSRLDNLSNGSAIVRLVAISGSLQRNGHGRQLSRMVEDYARNLGIKTLYLNATPEALEFYKKIGYEFYEWDPEELVGIAKDSAQMRKIL